MNKTLLRDIQKANPGWFSSTNRRFFNDREYFAYQGETTGKRYLVRSTYAWTDMFGLPPRLHYRVNSVSEQLKIGQLVEQEFKTLDDVEEWLQFN